VHPHGQGSRRNHWHCLIMSILSTRPVLKCVRCGDSVIVGSLSTRANDADGKILHGMLRDLSKSALCPNCLGQHNYAAEQARVGQK
jgi:hypothetical protein